MPLPSLSQRQQPRSLTPFCSSHTQMVEVMKSRPALAAYKLVSCYHIHPPTITTVLSLHSDS
ncbi:hypothetical protein M3J09_008132 [Ascochyta lentis]